MESTSQTSDHRLTLKQLIPIHVASVPWTDLPPVERLRGRRRSPSGENRGIRWGKTSFQIGRIGSPGGMSKATTASYPASSMSPPQTPRNIQLPFQFHKPTYAPQSQSKPTSPTRNYTDDVLFSRNLMGHRYAVEHNSRVRIREVYRSQPRLRPLLYHI